MAVPSKKFITKREGGPSTGFGVKKIDISSNKSPGKKISIAPATAAFLYYESILQDSVRAVVTFTDTGGSIDNKTAMVGLPIVGQENVQISVRDNNDNELKMTLYVN